MAVKEKKMPLRTGFPVWGWMAGAVLITVVVALGYRSWQTEHKLKTLRHELVAAKEEAIQARSEAAERERVAEDLRLKLKEAEGELQRLNEAADQAKVEASEREKQIAMLRQGMASCDEVFEAWDEVKASPPSILAIFRIAREADAARDCIDKGDVATACKHWQRLLVKIEKIGSPVRESRVEIEDLMRQNDCEK